MDTVRLERTGTRGIEYYEAAYESETERLDALQRHVRSGALDSARAIHIGRQLGFGPEQLEKLQAVKFGVTSYGSRLDQVEVNDPLGAHSALYSRFLAKEWTARRPSGPFEGWDCEYTAEDPKTHRQLFVVTRGNEILVRARDTDGRTTHRHLVGGKDPHATVDAVLKERFAHVVGSLPPEVLALTGLSIEPSDGPRWDVSVPDPDGPSHAWDRVYEVRDEATGWSFSVGTKGEEGRLSFLGPLVPGYEGATCWGELFFEAGNAGEQQSLVVGGQDPIQASSALLEKLPRSVRKLLGDLDGVTNR